MEKLLSDQSFLGLMHSLKISLPQLGIIFEAYSPLGCPARPFKTDEDPVVMDDPIIKEIAEKKSVSPAQVQTLGGCSDGCEGVGLITIIMRGEILIVDYLPGTILVLLDV